MNKEEILNEIKKAEEHLANMKKMLAECEYKRWKPEPNEEYYYVSEDGKIVQARNCGWEPVANRVKFYNCFKSEKQAEAEAEKILVRRQLEDIARRLNKGQEIDWNDNNQLKYCIGFDFPFNIISIGALYRKLQGSVYCLSDEFKDVAIQEIGEERLKKYFKGE